MAVSFRSRDQGTSVVLNKGYRENEYEPHDHSELSDMEKYIVDTLQSYGNELDIWQLFSNHLEWIQDYYPDPVGEMDRALLGLERRKII